MVDGNHRGISASIFRSCAGRDQIGMMKIADTSWLTEYPVNPVNIGQIVNNENKTNAANVRYQELQIPQTFPVLLRKFLPNINYEVVDGHSELRVVYLEVRLSKNSDENNFHIWYLQALRDIEEGEELFSSYFTVITEDLK